jgi:hypothetical protein
MYQVLYGVSRERRDVNLYIPEAILHYTNERNQRPTSDAEYHDNRLNRGLKLYLKHAA